MATPSARKTAAENASPDERAAAGKAARAEAPRSSHGEWEPAAGRLSPVELISRQDATRVPELVPLRHGRMLASAFTFYRGAAGIMAADLANTPRSGFEVQACGDAHLSNFGAFAAPDRELMFDVNDFDETLPGPWEWDLKRLIASFEIAGRDRDFGRKDRRRRRAQRCRSYRETMRRLAPLSNLDVWYVRIDVDRIREERAGKATKRELRMFENSVTKARSKTRLKAFEKLTHRVNGELRIINDPPLVVPLEDLLSPAESERADEALRVIVGSYRDSLMPDRRRLFDTYRYVHVARKVVGVGSVGTRAWIALFVGRDEDDPLFLQIKEAEASVLEPYVGASQLRHHGQRVVEGQRLTQAASDIMLGWLTAEGPDGRRARLLCPPALGREGVGRDRRR